MARKRYSDEDLLGIVRQVEVELASVADLATAIISNFLSPPLLQRTPGWGLGCSSLPPVLPPPPWGLLHLVIG